MSMKASYVRGARAVRSGLSATRVLPVLDSWAAHSRAGSWARSLLSIYDVEELVALDVPWWTYESAALVESFLVGRRDARVLEWGSGASTVWLASRSGQVVAIEHDSGWADVVRELIPHSAPVDLRTVPGTPAAGRPGEIRSEKAGARDLDFQSYVGAIDEVGGAFDLVVIDGRARAACLQRALPHLVDDGMIVMDNVERRRYREAIAALGTRVRVTWTRGLTPALPYPSRTALLRWGR